MSARLPYSAYTVSQDVKTILGLTEESAETLWKFAVNVTGMVSREFISCFRMFP